MGAGSSGRGAGAAAGRIRVVVAGAAGRMGREAAAAVLGAPDLCLVGAVSRSFGHGNDGASPLEAEFEAKGVAVFGELERCLAETRPDVLVEFTAAEVAPALLRAALEAGVRPVSGTTGISPEELARLEALTLERGLGAVVVPNFSLGATVLGILARKAATYFRAAEIIELHHDQKRDAPSGTALALARAVGRNLARDPGAEAGGGRTGAGEGPGEAGSKRHQPAVASPGRDDLVAAGRDPALQRRGGEGEARSESPRGASRPGMAQPSRGLEVEGVPVHSVRLAGLVAHHELIFASTGETLILRHDSVSRASFMPGVLLAVRAVGNLHGLVTSLEELLRVSPPGALLG